MTRACLDPVLVRAAALLAAWLVPAMAGAQSLAGVAKAEEARRKQQPKPAKVYTNQDLEARPDDAPTPRPPHPPVAPPGPPGAPLAGHAGRSGASAAEPALPPPTPARDQAIWARSHDSPAREQPPPLADLRRRAAVAHRLPP